ncbi:hypothetical protein MTO96_049878 [Rhipicephalus appendiculatus]
MRMHRYKCTEIVVNVLSPHFVELLVADIGDSKYSLIIDEATDISTTKLLGVVVRYFSAAQKSIVTTFLALIELDDGTAVTIVRALKNLLTRMGLDKKRLLGIGVDNASVNTGVNNGIFETIKLVLAFRVVLDVCRVPCVRRKQKRGRISDPHQCAIGQQRLDNLQALEGQIQSHVHVGYYNCALRQTRIIVLVERAKGKECFRRSSSFEMHCRCSNVCA